METIKCDIIKTAVVVYTELENAGWAKQDLRITGDYKLKTHLQYDAIPPTLRWVYECKHSMCKSNKVMIQSGELRGQMARTKGRVMKMI